jgi:hypothetical protein
MQRDVHLRGVAGAGPGDDQWVISRAVRRHADGWVVFTATAANLQASCIGLFTFRGIQGSTLARFGRSSVPSSAAMLVINVLFFPPQAIRVQLTLFFTPWFYV